VLPGLSVITTPGHTAGHQCVVVAADARGSDSSVSDVMVGDAAYTPRLYREPADDKLPEGQASDPVAWRDSLRRIQSTGAAQLHFCHHADVIHA
jgi:glyoxylase-like metal-dependent hydrolase (beta-lactamase superfamily II)